MLVAPLAARSGTAAVACRNLASRRGKPVVQRSRPTAVTASWLVAAAVCRGRIEEEERGDRDATVPAGTVHDLREAEDRQLGL
jgi:hypothetical protein